MHFLWSAVRYHSLRCKEVPNSKFYLGNNFPCIRVNLPLSNLQIDLSHSQPERHNVYVRYQDTRLSCICPSCLGHTVQHVLCCTDIMCQTGPFSVSLLTQVESPWRTPEDFPQSYILGSTGPGLTGLLLAPPVAWLGSTHGALMLATCSKSCLQQLGHFIRLLLSL